MLEKIKENPRLVVAVLITAGVIALLVGSGSNTNQQSQQEESAEAQSEQVASEPDAASESESDENETSTNDTVTGTVPAAGPVEVQENEGNLTATVRLGDNQTVIVRQIVNQYLENTESTLSPEKRLFAETVLVNALPRNDSIFAGQVISLSEEQVKTVVEQSNQLSEAQIARWSAYL